MSPAPSQEQSVYEHGDASLPPHHLHTTGSSDAPDGARLLTAARTARPSKRSARPLCTSRYSHSALRAPALLTSLSSPLGCSYQRRGDSPPPPPLCHAHLRGLAGHGSVVGPHGRLTGMPRGRRAAVPSGRPTAVPRVFVRVSGRRRDAVVHARVQLRGFSLRWGLSADEAQARTTSAPNRRRGRP